MTHWRHRDPARLEGQEFAPADGDAGVIDCLAEDFARQRHLTMRQGTAATHRTGWGSARSLIG
ncbi:MAG: hypothetical protein ACK4IB_03685 [Erythrobacter sp.]